MNKNYYEGIPVVPLRGLVVFPYTYVSFDVGRDMSVAAIEAASNNGGTIFLVAQKDQKLSEITKDNLFSTGCVCRIKNIVKLPGETIQVTVCGLFRAVVDGFSQEEPFFAAEDNHFCTAYAWRKSSNLYCLCKTFTQKFKTLFS